eukprot:s11925_g1.t1
MPANSEKQHLSIVICGHVDSGKSTTTGRLIFELGGLPERELEKLQAERLGKGSFALASFMDRQKEERERGVTISCTTKEFFTEKWHYTSGRVIPSWFIPTSGAAGLDTGQRCQGTKYRTSPQMSASYMRYLILLLAAQTIAADARVIDEFEGEPSMTSAGWLSVIFCTTFLLMLFGMLVGEAWSRFWYGRSLSRDGINLCKLCDQSGTRGSDVGIPGLVHRRPISTLTRRRIKRKVSAGVWGPGIRRIRRRVAFRAALRRLLQQQVAFSADRVAGARRKWSRRFRYTARRCGFLPLLLIGVPALPRRRCCSAPLCQPAQRGGSLRVRIIASRLGCIKLGRFDKWCAMRVGEASNPGPLAARVTKKKRLEKAMQSPNAQGGIEALIRPVIERLLKELLSKLNGDLVAQLLSPAASVANPRRRPRKPKAAGAAPVESGSQAPASAPAPAPVGKGGFDKGSGKGGGKDGQAKAEAKGTGKGKGDGASTATSAEPTEEWHTVSRRQEKPWALRAADWDASIVPFDELASKVEGAKPGETVRAVLHVSPEQLEIAATMLKGAGKPRAVLLLTSKPCASDPQCVPQRCPGERAGPSKAGVVQKITPVKTVVLYFQLHQRFMQQADWQEARKNPQRYCHGWLAKRHARISDSWGWQCEALKEGPWHKIHGCIKVPESSAISILSLSGQSGIFLNPSRSMSTPRWRVDWADQLADESGAAYLARVSTAGADYGLVAGRTQLGKRNKRAADEFLSRVWLLPDVPSSFSPDQVQELLQQNFEDVELIRQRRRRAWFVD